MRKTFLIPAAIALALGGAAAYANEQMHEHGRHHEMMQHELKQLDLSDTQKQSIKSIMEAAHQGHGQDDMSQMHQSLHALNPDAPDYATQVTALQDQAAGMARAHVAQMADVKRQVWAVLTPAQKAKWASLPQEEHHGHHGG